MVNEERVKLMTQAACFEEKQRRKALAIMRFYRKDYISFHMILIWLSVTAAFFIGVLFWLFYQVENASSMILANFTNLMLVGIILIGIYLSVTIIYLFAAYWYYSEKYDRAKQMIKKYQVTLKKLNRLYEKDEISGNGVGGSRL